MEDIRGILIAMALGGISAIGFSLDWSTYTNNAQAILTELIKNEDSWKKSPELVLRKLAELAAYPQDPSLPNGIFGQNDEHLNSIPLEQRQELIALSKDAIRKSNFKPYHTLAIARLAFSLGEYNYGDQLIAEAAHQGSAIAHAIIGDEAEDIDVAIYHYQAAVDGGFSNAQESLDYSLNLIREEKARIEAERLQAEAEAAAIKQKIMSSFARPELIEALKEGRVSTFRNLRELIYLKNLVVQLEEPSAQYKAPGIQLVIERSAGKVLAYKMSTNPQMIKQSADVALTNLFGMFKGMVETHQRGGSVYEGVAAANKGATTVLVGGDIADGEKDGFVMITLFNEDPDSFKEIYDGILNVINNM